MDAKDLIHFKGPREVVFEVSAVGDFGMANLSLPKRSLLLGDCEVIVVHVEATVGLHHGIHVVGGAQCMVHLPCDTFHVLAQGELSWLVVLHKLDDLAWRDKWCTCSVR